MERYSYLWGTQGKNYCELGSSPKIANMLRGLGTTNPEMALDELRQMFFGFHILPGYADQKNPPLAIRYAPVYLNKRPFYALRLMQPFAVLCVNGLEHTASERESIYSFLTLMRLEDLLGSSEYSWMDQIFGSHFLTMKEEEAHKLKTRPIDFEQEPEPVVLPDFTTEDKKPAGPEGYSAKDTAIAIRCVWELYKSVGRRVVIRLERGADFNSRALALLKAVYSLLPARMAAETGFATYERPENIIDLVKELNTRIFILPAECHVDRAAHLPMDCAFLDYSLDEIEAEDRKNEKSNSPEAKRAEEVRPAERASEENPTDKKPADPVQEDLRKAAEALQPQEEEDNPFGDDYRELLLARLKAAQEEENEGPGEEKRALLQKWCRLSWEKRKPVIDAIYTDESLYLDRSYYLDRMETFFANPFFQWVEAPKIPFAYSDETEDLVKETVALYKEYRSFPICRVLPWAKDLFAGQIPEVLTPLHSLRKLREAMEAYNTRMMSDEAHRKCEAYILWLRDMEARRARLKRAAADAITGSGRAGSAVDDLPAAKGKENSDCSQQGQDTQTNPR